MYNNHCKDFLKCFKMIISTCAAMTAPLYLLNQITIVWTVQLRSKIGM